MKKKKNNIAPCYTMSASYLFSQSTNTIDPKFLPANAIQTLSEVLAEGNTSGPNNMILEGDLFLPNNTTPDIIVSGLTGSIDCTTLRVNAPGPTNVIQLSSNGSVTCGSASVGGSTTVGGGIVNLQGTLGISRVNDPIYNPSVSIAVSNFGTLGPAITAGTTGVIGTSASPGPGLYRLQCQFTMVNNGGFSIPTGAIALFVSLANGTGFRLFSEINITNAMLFQPSLGTSNDPSYSSAVFAITDSVAYAVGYEVSGTAPANNWNLGTGGLVSFQLVKVQ